MTSILLAPIKPRAAARVRGVLERNRSTKFGFSFGRLGLSLANVTNTRIDFGGDLTSTADFAPALTPELQRRIAYMLHDQKDVGVPLLSLSPDEQVAIDRHRKYLQHDPDCTDEFLVLDPDQNFSGVILPAHALISSAASVTSTSKETPLSTLKHDNPVAADLVDALLRRGIVHEIVILAYLRDRKLVRTYYHQSLDPGRRPTEITNDSLMRFAKNYAQDICDGDFTQIGTPDIRQLVSYAKGVQPLISQNTTSNAVNMLMTLSYGDVGTTVIEAFFDQYLGTISEAVLATFNGLKQATPQLHLVDSKS